MDEKSIMINLGDEKAKEIAEVIGNKTCVKILDLLADGDLTVTDISNKLKIAINTVDYNVKKLVKSGLIEKSSHFWSVKGKRMPTYKVSNRKIIISPRKSMAKIFGWTLGLTGLAALTIREFTKVTYIGVEDLAKARGGDYVAGEALAVAPVAFESTEAAGVGVVSFLSTVSPWSWFLLGAWFAVFLFFVITLINDKRHKL